MRVWIVLLSLVVVSFDAMAAPCPPKEDIVNPHEITRGSTFSFGTTYVGSELTHTFQLINKDETRPMIITNFYMGSPGSLNGNNGPWIIKERPSSSIPPGGDDCFTVTLLGLSEGVYKTHFSWDADTDPPSEEDTSFVFGVKGEVLPPPNETTARQTSARSTMW